MTDRHAMAYMLNDECVAIGLTPYAVYGGKVYSFKDSAGTVHPHGCVRYAEALEQAAHAMMMRAAALAGARGC